MFQINVLCFRYMYCVLHLWATVLQKLKAKLFFKVNTYCLSRQKAMAFKVMYYFSLQSNSGLLSLVLSSMK